MQKQTMALLAAGSLISLGPFVLAGFSASLQSFLIAGIILFFTLFLAAANELNLARIQIKTLVENSVEAIVTMDGNSNIHSFNPAAEKLFGYKAEEVIGRKVTQLMPEEFVDGHETALARYLKTGKPHILGTLVEVVGLRKDGEEFPIELGIAEFKSFGTRLFTGSIRDITDRKKLEKELEALSQTDGLTGLNNRRSFDRSLQKEWNRSTRDPQPLSLIFLDIDFFKKYNDNYGHVQGDECLKKVATALSASVNRAGDFLARYGGEEFVVMLPGTDSEKAMTMAEMIRMAIENLKIEHSKSDVSPYVTISLGVGTIQESHGKKSESLIEAADSALYQAKQGGRNRTVLKEI